MTDHHIHHDPAVRALVERARAEAWDFGYACGLGDYGKSADETCSANPYREKSAR